MLIWFYVDVIKLYKVKLLDFVNGIKGIILCLFKVEFFKNV